MKAAPVCRAFSARSGVKQTLIHTGQHYDNNMSDIFFSQLAMPTPDVNLEVGSGSHAQQTAEVMWRFEPIVQERKPDMCALGTLCPVPVKSVTWGSRVLRGSSTQRSPREEGGDRRSSKVAFSRRG